MNKLAQTEEWAEGEAPAVNLGTTDQDQIKTSINRLSNKVDGFRSFIQVTRLPSQPLTSYRDRPS